MHKTLALALALGLSGAAVAQTHGGHSGHGAHGAHGSAAPAANAPAVQEYRAANDRMHKDMDIAFTGDPDVDFFKAMIPHHQGAIDMARVVLRHGKDPEAKKLAQEIIAAQEKEIAQMRASLKAKGVALP